MTLLIETFCTIVFGQKRQLDGQNEECREHVKEMTTLKKRLLLLQAHSFELECDENDEEGVEVASKFKRNSLILSSRSSLLESSEA